MVVENKHTVTQQLMEQLQQHAGKVGFMPDAAILDAVRYLETKGIPGQKHEDYKYCNLEAVFRRDFKTVSRAAEVNVDHVPYLLEDCINIVVVNGRYRADLSDQAAGCTISTLGEADKAIVSKHITHYADVSSDAFIALNTAFSEKGLFIQIRSVLSKPLHILNISSAGETALLNARQLVVADANTEATVIESFVSDAGQAANLFHNHLTEVLVGENAKLQSYRLQVEGLRTFQVNTTQAEVKRYGNYTTHTFTFGGALVRNNLNVVLADDLCEAHLNGLFITNGSQLTDNHTLVDHRKPNCQSNELYKGIAKDKSTGVFNGKIFVRKDAQKTNAYQSSKNILLSDEASINTKPQLEIYADDVKCSHGTSTGKVDENALFYLKARGIGEESARRLLLQAFAQELIDNITVESLQKKVLAAFEKTI